MIWLAGNIQSWKPNRYIDGEHGIAPHLLITSSKGCPGGLNQNQNVQLMLEWTRSCEICVYARVFLN